MTQSIEVVIYLAIASLALLPAVFALAAGSFGPLLARRRFQESEAYEDLATGLEAALRADQSQSLVEIEKAVEAQKRQFRRTAGMTADVSFGRAVMVPATAWSFALGLACVLKFSNVVPARFQDAAAIAAFVLLAIGYLQLLKTLRSSSRAAGDSATSLDLRVSEPFETEASKKGAKQFTLQVDMVAANRSSTVERSVQFEVEIPPRGIITPVGKPKEIERNGRLRRVLYTPHFPVLKPQDSYKQFLLLVPVESGNYTLRVRATSEDGLSETKRVQFHVGSIPQRQTPPPRMAEQGATESAQQGAAADPPSAGS